MPSLPLWRALEFLRWWLDRYGFFSVCAQPDLIFFPHTDPDECLLFLSAGFWQQDLKLHTVKFFFLVFGDIFVSETWPHMISEQAAEPFTGRLSQWSNLLAHEQISLRWNKQRIICIYSLDGFLIRLQITSLEIQQAESMKTFLYCLHCLLFCYVLMSLLVEMMQSWERCLISVSVSPTCNQDVGCCLSL